MDKDKRNTMKGFFFLYKVMKAAPYVYNIVKSVSRYFLFWMPGRNLPQWLRANIFTPLFFLHMDCTMLMQ